MSLHRVASITSYETVQRQRSLSPTREHQRMTFNPIATETDIQPSQTQPSQIVPPHQQPQKQKQDEGAPALPGLTGAPPAAEIPLSAFEIGRTKRICQVIAAVVYCLLSAGVVFGFAAIKPVFVAEGVYGDYCTEVNLRLSPGSGSRDEGASLTGDEKTTTCYEQEIRLNLMFTIAAVATNVCALPVGTILDRYGPRISGIIGAGLLALGSVLLAFAHQVSFDAYIPGYLLLALGGPFVFISSFQLSNTFPRYSGLILALLTGAFDSSSAVFLFYRLIYDNTNGTFTPGKFFALYLIVPVYVVVVQLAIMPSTSYKTVGELMAEADAVDDPQYVDQAGSNIPVRQEREEHRETVVSEVSELLGKKGEPAQQREEAKKKHISGVWGAMHGRSAYQQIMSPWFALITVFTVVQMTRINYFVATVRTQYEFLLHSEHLAANVNHVFDVALPLGGIIAIPFIGLILDNTSTTLCLSILVAVATVIGVFGLLPYLWSAYANIALFVLYRPFYYTAVSDYAAKVFGFQTFGKVYGLVICTAGLLNFSQSALDALTHRVFLGDPVPVNVLLLVVALVVGVVLVVFVWWKSRQGKRGEVESEAERARDVPVPGPTTYGT